MSRQRVVIDVWLRWPAREVERNCINQILYDMPQVPAVVGPVSTALVIMAYRVWIIPDWQCIWRRFRL